MRGLKVAGWAILGVIVLLVLASIAVVAFVDPNDYKDDIAKAVRDRTGRELKLDGNLSLSVFPWLAIETGHAVWQSGSASARARSSPSNRRTSASS